MAIAPDDCRTDDTAFLPTDRLMFVDNLWHSIKIVAGASIEDRGELRALCGASVKKVDAIVGMMK